MPHRAPTRELLDLPLAEPTEAAPGTPEKVAVLRQRYERGLALWHPDDGWPTPGVRPRGWHTRRSPGHALAGTAEAEAATGARRRAETTSGNAGW